MLGVGVAVVGRWVRLANNFNGTNVGCCGATVVTGRVGIDSTAMAENQESCVTGEKANGDLESYATHGANPTAGPYTCPTISQG
jgi:hypothetical protein